MSYTTGEQARDIMKKVTEEFPQFDRNINYDEYRRMMRAIESGVNDIEETRRLYTVDNYI